MAENILPELKNDELVATMNAVKANETKETQSAFVTAAIKAKYFTPVDIIDATGAPLEGSGKIEIPKDAKFNFKLLKNQKGEQFFPLFTDINEYQKWNKSDKIKAIVVTFPQMADLVSKQPNTSGFVINPMSQNMIFTRELLDNLLKAIGQNMTKTNTNAPPEGKQQITFQLGKPANIPDSVIASFNKTLAKNPEVKKVYLLMIKQNEKEHYLFVLDIDAEPEKCTKIAESLCATARLFLSKFPVVAAPYNSPYGQNADKVTEPFYVKE